MVTSWENTTLENITSVITKGTTPTSIGKSFTLTGINFIKIECIDKSGQFDKSMFEHIDVETNNILKRSQLNDGDILFSIAGALGRIAIVDERVLPANTNQALAIIRLKKASDAPNRRYVYYQLQSEKTKRIIEEINVSGAQANLSLDNISNLIIPIPEDVKEQERIAEALSDVDSLISSLEKLIAKKKSVKQGAMQELLTGKKRLPEFTGEWNTFIFGELFDFIPNNAFTRAQMSDSGKVKNIHYGDILTLFGSCIDGDNNSIPYINQDIDLTRFADRCYLQSGDIIIADTAEDETVGKALEIYHVNCPILAGQHTLLCRPKIKFADKFLGYYLNAACYHDQLLPFIVGTKVSSISKSSVAQTKLIAPDVEEQTAIASILSDMDNEIKALEQKLEKTRQIKQGMMQQLLTGKIRLV